MNKIFLSISMVSLCLLVSCEKDEGILPDIHFKTGGNYISSDMTLPGGSSVLIGIEAAKTEDKDVLKKFNISKSIDGATPVTIYDQDLSGSEGDNYSYDFNTTIDTVSSQMEKYTFTVTNRDGLVNQVSLTLTVE
ncbi:MAG: hypothetical protein KDC80_16575 [Saprospiraceae bacterium]|nr:hypothetical protein [Saprospiraceae bacterium]